MPDIAPSPALVRFAERQIRMARDVERRSEARHFFARPAVVQGVDQQLCPLGPPLAAVTRDISPGGIGLIFDGSIDHDLVALRFAIDDEEACLLMEIRWRKPMEPFAYVGGRVLRELDYFPTTEAATEG